MNGYQIHMDSYKEMLSADITNLDREYIRSEIKALEPFAERTEEEILKMFDVGAFNDVLKAYCRKAMENCNIDVVDIESVMNEIRYLLDTVGAVKILKS